MEKSEYVVKRVFLKCREKGNSGSQGHIFQKTETKMMTIETCTVVNYPGENQEFFSHADRDACKEYLGGLRLVHTIFKAKKQVSSVIRERKCGPGMSRPAKMPFKYRRSPT